MGYPNPDRSHFPQYGYWQTASASDKYLKTGWIGRYLDAQCNGCSKPTQAIETDDVLSIALKGEKEKGIACVNPQRLYNSSREPLYKKLLQAHTSHNEEQPLDYLYKNNGGNREQR